jgi:hypothetical protein
MVLMPTPSCIECGRSAQTARGWQGHLVDADDDGEDEVGFFVE